MQDATCSMPLGADPLAPEAAGIDAALMERTKGGDRQAFGELVNRHRDGLVNYLSRISGDRELAQDLAQESFVKLFQSAGHYKEKGLLRAYLYRIATNCFRSHQRRARRASWVPFATRDHDGSSPGTPQERLLQSEALRHLDAALAELPARFRAPLVLHAIEGWPLAQIAYALSCPKGTVKSRIGRARRDLRRKLSDLLPRGVL